AIPGSAVDRRQYSRGDFAQAGRPRTAALARPPHAWLGWGRDRRDTRAGGGAALSDLRPARLVVGQSHATLLLAHVPAGRPGALAGRTLPRPGRAVGSAYLFGTRRAKLTTNGRRMILDDLLRNPIGALQQIVLMIPGFLAAVTVHEVAHGWVANRLGD